MQPIFELRVIVNGPVFSIKCTGPESNHPGWVCGAGGMLS